MGSLYGLLAMSVALLWRTTRALSFAHGEIGGFTALVAITVINEGAPWGVAAALSLVLAAFVALGFQIAVGRRIPSHNPVGLTVATVGLLLLLIAVGQRLWGVYPRVLAAPFGAVGVNALGALVAPSQVVALLTCIAGASMITLLLRRSSVGLATLAAAHDRDEAALLGVPVAAISVGVWAVSAVLAAVAALLFGPVIGAIAPGTMTMFFLRSLVAVAVGGMGSMWGPVAGGVVVGVVEQVAVAVWLHSGVPGVDVLSVLVLLIVASTLRGRVDRLADAA